MIGSKFPEATTALGAPEGMEDEVYALPVWHTPGHPAFISKWELSWKERLHCLIFGYVWLHVLSLQHPPVAIETHYPFEREEVPIGLGIRHSIIFIALLVIAMIAGLAYLYSIGELIH